MGDRIVVMKDGHIFTRSVHPLDIYNNPDNMFVVGFIGSPAMNFLDVLLQKEGEVYTIDARPSNWRSPRRRPLPSRDSAITWASPLSWASVLRTLKMRGPCEGGSQLFRHRGRRGCYRAQGAEVYVYFSSGENSFIARLDASTTARDGMKAKVGLNMMKIHLFDLDTEEVIR